MCWVSAVHVNKFNRIEEREEGYELQFASHTSEEGGRVGLMLYSLYQGCHVCVKMRSACNIVHVKFFSCYRVKLKHFEKFQDTTEALAGTSLFTVIIIHRFSLCVCMC